MSHRRKHRLKLKSLYVWHRYVGLTAALFVLLLASSGIAINHTEALMLDSRFVQNRWLLDWYGIQAPDTARSATTARGPVILLGTKLYSGTRPIDGEFDNLYGAVTKDDLLIAAVDHDLLLLTVQGEYVERLSKGDGAPGDIEGLAVDSQGRLIVRTESGVYRADTQLLDWQPWTETAASIAWSTPQPLSGAAISALQADYLGRILPWERVLLDLHSGRLFGNLGTWLMDAAAVLMLFLAGSGVVIWRKRQR